MATELAALVEVSRTLGADIGAIQGGGGNTSVKVGAAMWVKASGRTLAGIDGETGFVEVDWQRLAADVRTCADEAAYAALLGQCRLGGAEGARASIETGFHALLGPCVLHSHSVRANLLTCALEGPDRIAALFPEAAFAPYATPGIALTHRLAAAIGERQPQVVFLQNHGLIVAAAQPEAALALHGEVEARIATAYPGLPPFNPAASADLPGLLFPDQAVFHGNPALSLTRAGRETMAACAWLIAAIPAAGLTPRFLDAAEAMVLTGMESEKHRQGLAR